jgi:hypothetical protein
MLDATAMPQGYDKPHPYRKPYSLANAARDEMLVVVRCHCCHRTITYVAADLVELAVDPDQDALRPLFGCSICKTGQFIRVTLRSAVPGDYGHLPVRRPAEIVRVQKWHTVCLGDEAKGRPASLSRFAQYLNEAATGATDGS